MPRQRPSAELVRTATEVLGDETLPSKVDTSSIKYSDGFVKVYTDHIELLNFYFPTAAPKYIQFNEIDAIYTNKTLKLTWWGMKDWGMSLSSKIWWAQDETRDGAYTAEKDPKYVALVFKIKNTWIMNGFSVEEPDVILKVLKENMPKSVQFNTTA